MMKGKCLRRSVSLLVFQQRKGEVMWSFWCGKEEEVYPGHENNKSVGKFVLQNIK
jgi:hypothetical protein